VDSISELRKDYLKKKGEIDKRLKEFHDMWSEPEDSVFSELCFCILTPQSKAKNADKAIKSLERTGSLKKGGQEEVSKTLKGLVRFHNNKGKYIIEARGKFSKKCICAENAPKAREWLVETIKGLGYKEASHFLRNIGFGKDIAILDRHILKNLKKFGVIPDVPKTLTRKRYLEIEGKMRDFSRKIGIPMDAIDLLFWSTEAGEIFK
jgi:N-glycosylase/DNA lyase